jgi:cob(I)alamin adenosyltransferase
MLPAEAMQRVDTLLSHVWMVRTFLKHSDEVTDDEQLADIHRTLYDCMLALGGPLKEGNADEYLKMARKKLARLKRAAEQFRQLQPEVSTHMNFQMAVQSLSGAVNEIAAVLETP